MGGQSVRILFPFLYFRFGEFDINILGIVVVVFTIPLLAATIITSQKSRYYALTPEEWLFLDVHLVHKNLINYLKESKEIYRIEAVKKLESGIRKVSDWRFGRLRLVRNVVGEKIDTFKRDFGEKLLAAIEEGDRTNLSSSLGILEDLSGFLLYPKAPIEQLDDINLKISKLSVVKSEKPSRILSVFQTSPKLQHFTALLGCAIGGILSFYIGVHFVGVSRETAYVVGFSFAGVLLLAYVETRRVKAT